MGTIERERIVFRYFVLVFPLEILGKVLKGLMMMKRIFLTTVALLMAMGCAQVQTQAQVQAQSPCPQCDPQIVQLTQHPTVDHMLRVSNWHRTNAGLTSQKISPRYCAAAQDHANYMARTSDFQHYSNGGPTGRVARYSGSSTGMENIAMGQWDVLSAFQTWRNSGGHWASMASATTHCGFGHQVSASGAKYWVALYGNDTTAEGDMRVRIVKEPVIASLDTNFDTYLKTHVPECLICQSHRITDYIFNGGCPEMCQQWLDWQTDHLFELHGRYAKH